MTSTDEMQDHNKGNGLFVIVVLAIVFFSIVFLTVLYWPSDRQSSSQAEQTLYVVGLELKVRTRPDSKGPVVTTLTRDATVRLIEADGPWARVATSDGFEGWVERNLLQTEPERVRWIERAEAIRKLAPLAAQMERSAQAYSGPGIFYPELGTVARGQHLAVFSRDHDFYAVEIDGQIVYIEVDAVDLTGTRGPNFQIAAATEEAETPPPVEEIPPQEPQSLLGRLSDLLGVEPHERAPVAEEVLPGPDQIWQAVPSGGTEPKLVQRVTPRYPSSARRSGIEGAVIIQAVILKDGSVEQARILKDLPMGLGIAAREAVERWRFIPATHNGEPINVYYTVTVNYALSAR